MFRASIVIFVLNSACTAIDTYTEASSSCVWPKCAPYCLACNERLHEGSECTVEKALANETCGRQDYYTDDAGLLRRPGICQAQAATNSNLETAYCICPYGSCSDEKAKNCVQKQCFPGAKPPLYKPSLAAISYASISASFLGRDLPNLSQINFSHSGEPNASRGSEFNSTEFSDAWWDFLQASTYLPVGFVIFGLCSTAMSCSCIGMPFCLGIGEQVSCCLVFVLSILSFVLTVIALERARNANQKIFKSYEITLSGLDRSIDELMVLVAELAEVTQRLIYVFFHDVPKSCIWPVGGILELALSSQQDKIRQVNLALAALNDVVEQHRPVMKLMSQLIYYSVVLAYNVPLFPLILMQVFITSVVLFVLLTAVGHHNVPVCIKFAEGSCRHIYLTASQCCNFGFVIYAGVMLAFTIAASGFCLDPSLNTLVLMGSEGAPGKFLKTVYTPQRYDIRLLDYYVMGHYANPLRTQVSTGAHSILVAKEGLFKFEWLMNAAEFVCPAFNSSQIATIMDGPVDLMKTLNTHLAAESVWPEYNRLILEATCDHALTSLGVASLTTCILSACLWPCLSCALVVYLKDWAEEVHEDEMEDRESFKLMHGSDPEDMEW